ncbi:hypothetical protein CBER1_08499 [Cercospora berteroae]|uniref:Ubiquitin carboxyl-terminal hydrolase n=1 Tax=Cercospora berteroae TaxID=357750 RepID=A0A2S6CGG5_9PEZI|nr:hypothetical protein CBER1_08499 [Cercospora berteroae]
MPPKRGKKRKHQETTNGGGTNGNVALAPPDRDAWKGWVEMESEPAFFNVMLKEMGVRGAKVQEVLSIDEEGLAMLPRPVHALIFLFRYKTQDEQDQYTGAPQKHIWFANQVPDFACATIATLNIVNNIPGLQMGKELREFRELTKDMDPIERGREIDRFDFVRRIHNSFASENDILTADLHARGKIAKAKKKAAVEKAKATRQKNKVKDESDAEAPTRPTRAERASRRSRTPTIDTDASSTKSSKPTQKAVKSAKSSSEPDADGEFKLSGKGKARVTKLKGPCPPDSETDEDVKKQPRRSGRARKALNRDVYVAEAPEVHQSGFHFIAYMPIGDHVWKLDGLDYHPHDMGSFGVGGNGADGGTGDWLHLVAPVLQDRMQIASDEGEHGFTLLAVVHDSILEDRQELCCNIKTLQAIDKRLDNVYHDWRNLDEVKLQWKAETLLGPSNEYDVFNFDIDQVKVPKDIVDKLEGNDDLSQLIKLRQQSASRQTQIRSSMRDVGDAEERDAERAKHRRHDYGKFVRRWLGALADQGTLEDVLG